MPSQAQRDLIDEFDLTEDEARAITSLQRLARSWPSSLMLASMAGQLHVMRRADALAGDGLNQDAVVADISGIPNTGGDW